MLDKPQNISINKSKQYNKLNGSLYQWKDFPVYVLLYTRSDITELFNSSFFVSNNSDALIFVLVSCRLWRRIGYNIFD